MKAQFEVNDRVKYKNKFGFIQTKQYMTHMDMFIYLVRFNEFEIVLRENELEKA